MRLFIRFFAPLALLLAFLTPASPATAAPAEIEHFETFILNNNTCNSGELVFGEGTGNTVFKEQKDGSFEFIITIHGTAVGTQGNEYVVNFTEKQQITTDPASFTDDFRTVLVSKGSAPNEMLVFHFDSNSGLTVQIDCRG